MHENTKSIQQYRVIIDLQNWRDYYWKIKKSWLSYTIKSRVKESVRNIVKLIIKWIKF